MAYIAELNHLNVVTKIKTVPSEEDFHGEYILSLKTGKRHVRFSYNTRGGIHYDPDTGEESEDQSKAFRKNAPDIGYTYDQSRDAFIPPRDFQSWKLNEEKCLWEAPVAMPTDGKPYQWDEENQSWIDIIPA